MIAFLGLRKRHLPVDLSLFEWLEFYIPQFDACVEKVVEEIKDDRGQDSRQRKFNGERLWWPVPTKTCPNTWLPAVGVSRFPLYCHATTQNPPKFRTQLIGWGSLGSHIIRNFLWPSRDPSPQDIYTKNTIHHYSSRIEPTPYLANKKVKMVSRSIFPSR